MDLHRSYHGNRAKCGIYRAALFDLFWFLEIEITLTTSRTGLHSRGFR